MHSRSLYAFVPLIAGTLLSVGHAAAGPLDQTASPDFPVTPFPIALSVDCVPLRHAPLTIWTR